MRVFKYFITSVCSLMMMLMIIVSIVFSGSLFSMPTEKDILNLFEEVGAYDAMVEKIQESLDIMVLQNNVPLSTVEDFVTPSEVQDIVSRDVTQLYEVIRGEREEVDALDISVFETRFEQRVNQFFLENGLYLDDEQRTDFDTMNETVLSVVKGTVQFMDWHALTSLPAVSTLRNVLAVLPFEELAIGLVVVIVVFGALNMLVWRREGTQGLLWNGYGVVAGGLMTFILFFSGYVSKFYEHIIINLDYVRDAIGIFIGDYFMLLFSVGLIVTLVGFILMIPYWRAEYKKMIEE